MILCYNYKYIKEILNNSQAKNFLFVSLDQLFQKCVFCSLNLLLERRCLQRGCFRVDHYKDRVRTHFPKQIGSQSCDLPLVNKKFRKSSLFTNVLGNGTLGPKGRTLGLVATDILQINRAEQLVRVQSVQLRNYVPVPNILALIFLIQHW